MRVMIVVMRVTRVTRVMTVMTVMRKRPMRLVLRDLDRARMGLVAVAVAALGLVVDVRGLHSDALGRQGAEEGVLWLEEDLP